MQSVKFLLVDDLEENLLSLEALLRRDGLECLMARSGEEALELLLVHDVALAMVDVQMPQMDGFQLAEFMRGAVRARHVPIIFLTAGSGDKQRRFRGYEAGAVDFIQKPIEPDILRSKANVFFELHRQRQQLAAQRDQLEAHAKALRAMEQLTRRELAHEQETARLREQFIAVLGHDLRNPLASIGGAARLLRKEPLSDKGQHVIRLMEASADRMAGLIDDVMDFARGRLGGGIAVERRAHDLEPILRQVVEELEASYPDRVVECDFQLPTQAPVDPGRLSQLVEPARQRPDLWRGPGAGAPAGRHRRRGTQPVGRQQRRPHSEGRHGAPVPSVRPRRGATQPGGAWPWPAHRLRDRQGARRRTQGLVLSERNALHPDHPARGRSPRLVLSRARNFWLSPA